MLNKSKFVDIQAQFAKANENIHQIQLQVQLHSKYALLYEVEEMAIVEYKLWHDILEILIQNT